MTTQSRIAQMIREAARKDFDAESWRDRLDEWWALHRLPAVWYSTWDLVVVNPNYKARVKTT
jgi:hypothetical protein